MNKLFMGDHKSIHASVGRIGFCLWILLICTNKGAIAFLHIYELLICISENKCVPLNIFKSKCMTKSILTIVSVLLCFACSKDDQSKLSGKWQMQQIETKGSVESIDTIYFNFENSLFQYQLYSPSNNNYTAWVGFNTISNGNQLLLELNDQKNITKFIHLTDWSEGKRMYTIEKLTGKRLILSSENKTYTFRKF